ncbi:hypothetical protein ACLOJK_019096 [Asimina triloba]
MHPCRSRQQQTCPPPPAATVAATTLTPNVQHQRVDRLPPSINNIRRPETHLPNRRPSVLPDPSRCICPNRLLVVTRQPTPLAAAGAIKADTHQRIIIGIVCLPSASAHSPVACIRASLSAQICVSFRHPRSIRPRRSATKSSASNTSSSQQRNPPAASSSSSTAPGSARSIRLHYVPSPIAAVGR